MYEGGAVEKLDDGGEMDSALSIGTGVTIRQQKERRSEAFAAAAE
jgi:hypothetical protein